MGWPRYGEGLGPELWAPDKRSQNRNNVNREKELREKNEAEIQLAIQLGLRKNQKRDIIIGTLIGLAIAILAIGLPTATFLFIMFNK